MLDFLLSLSEDMEVLWWFCVFKDCFRIIHIAYEVCNTSISCFNSFYFWCVFLRALNSSDFYPSMGYFSLFWHMPWFLSYHRSRILVFPDANFLLLSTFFWLHQQTEKLPQEAKLQHKLQVLRSWILRSFFMHFDWKLAEVKNSRSSS